MRLIFILLFASFFLLAKDVKVAAAANVGYALEEIVKLYKMAYPHSDIKITIGSSGKLAAQIENGAGYDIFLSADTSYPKRLYEKNLTYTKPVVYATGKLILASRNHIGSLDDIKIASRLAVANPKTAPYGKAAFEFLKSYGAYRSVKDKLVFGESVAQTLIYTLKAADMGLIAKSALYGANIPKLHYIDIPQNRYAPIKQAMVLIKPDEDAGRFFLFLLSKKSAEVFKRYGYD